MSPPATFRHATASQVCLQVQHRVRPKPAIHRLFEMLQRSPSLRTFVHRAAFARLKGRSADRTDLGSFSANGCFTKAANASERINGGKPTLASLRTGVSSAGSTAVAE
jgi:hypothetical protein